MFGPLANEGAYRDMLYPEGMCLSIVFSCKQFIYSLFSFAGSLMAELYSPDLPQFSEGIAPAEPRTVDVLG